MLFEKECVASDVANTSMRGWNKEKMIVRNRRKAYEIKLLLLCIGMFLLGGCKGSPVNVNEETEIPHISSAIQQVEAVYTTRGLSHEPYGWDNLYGAKEIPTIWWERSPRDPVEGEVVEIVVASWQDTLDMDIWLEWTLNGQVMDAVSCKHKANLNDSSQKKGKYIGEIGPFKQGDKVEYTIFAGNDGIGKKHLGPYSFSVFDWESLERVNQVEKKDGSVAILGESASLNPSIYLSFLQNGALQMRVDPLRKGDEERSLLYSSDISVTEETRFYSITDGNLSLEVERESYRIRVTDGFGRELVRCTEKDGLEILTDGEQVKGIRLNLDTHDEEEFYGFGMKYNNLNQRGKDVDIYCVNWYTDQADKTYTPVPYYFVPNQYGLYVDSTYYSKFHVDTTRDNVCMVEVSTGGDRNTGVDFYLFGGTNEEIISQYTDIVGKPILPPVWAFGPWISANEWNKQSEVMEQLEKSIKHEIPTSVIVLEAWSDEETFYTFNDSKYEMGGGDYIPKLKDFTFGGRWPDPKGMIDELHENGIKVLLWQIPVLKYSSSATLQSVRDQNYAEEKGYTLKEKDGSSYRIPDGTWFGNSLMVDFTNPEGTEWFLSKRQYLLSELGIDGFKTDGGEFVWGRDISSFNGTKGNELRNAYPDQYAQAYFDYARKWKEEAITFSRAGGASMQNHPICWIGDQHSSPNAFREAMHATLSASMSGIPFVAWDIAGFSGDVPSNELYQRSVAQAAFSPIMQIHSETSGDPVPSQARTPWNMAERKDNEGPLNTYRYFSNVRMNLLPYLYTEAMHSSVTGEPLMRSMAYAYPSNQKAKKYKYQYMLGEHLLVAPVIEMNQKEIEIYLPDGTWFGLFDDKVYEGGVYTLEAPLGEIPVFVRKGGILPMNLNEKYELGGFVGNKTESYDNIVIRIYEGGDSYIWYDYVNEKEVVIHVAADGKEVTINGLSDSITMELLGHINSIQVNGSEIQGTYDSSGNFTRFFIRKIK